MTGKPPALRGYRLLTCQSDAMPFECWIFSHGPDLIASQLLLEIAHWIPLSSQSVSSHLISTHLISRLVTGHSCSLLFSVTWTFLISSHLVSAFLKFHSSSKLFSALRSSCQLILCLLVSSLLFSHLLSSSHISSADLGSCQLVSHISALLSTLSNHLSSSLAQNLLQTRNHHHHHHH